MFLNYKAVHNFHEIPHSKLRTTLQSAFTRKTPITTASKYPTSNEVSIDDHETELATGQMALLSLL